MSLKLQGESKLVIKFKVNSISKLPVPIVTAQREGKKLDSKKTKERTMQNLDLMMPGETSRRETEKKGPGWQQCRRE